LTSGIADLFPSSAAAEGPLRATVFKIDRDAAGNRIAYVRMRAGSLAARTTVPVRRDGPNGPEAFSARIVRLRVFAHGEAKAASLSPSVTSGPVPATSVT